MRTLTPALLLASAALSTSAARATADTAPYCPPRPADNALQTKIFAEFLDTFLIAKDPKTAFLRHVTEDYIQHNPFALSGRQVAIDALGPAIPRNNYTILRTAVQGDIAFAHYKSVGPGSEGEVVTSSVIDVLRFDGTCIVEHWDLMATKTGKEVNPLAYF